MKVEYQNWCASKGTISEHKMELNAPSKFQILIKETSCYNGFRVVATFFKNDEVIANLFYDWQEEAAEYEELSIENVKNILKNKMRLSNKNIDAIVAYMAAFDVL